MIYLVCKTDILVNILTIRMQSFSVVFTIFCFSLSYLAKVNNIWYNEKGENVLKTTGNGKAVFSTRNEAVTENSENKTVIGSTLDGTENESEINDIKDIPEVEGEVRVPMHYDKELKYILSLSDDRREYLPRRVSVR